MIIITDEARDYLLAHGGVIHIRDQGLVSFFWGRLNLGPTVGRGEPANIRDYSYANINSIRVYRPRDFESPYTLTVNLRKFMGWQWLGLDGWKIV